MAKELTLDTSPDQHYFYQPHHLFGCYCVFFGYFLSICGFISLAWYWIFLLFYGIGWMISQKFNSIESSPQPVVQDKVVIKGKSQETNYFLVDFLKLKYRSEHLLPSVAVQRLNDIHKLMTSLNQQLSNRSHGFKSEVDKIQRIVNLYLTPTIDNYLKLPAFYAERRLLQGNKTAQELLIEQLSLLEDELYKTLDSVLQDNLDQLIIHGQFLQQKFEPYDFFKLENQKNSET